MRKPMFVRELSEAERQKLANGLRAPEPFRVRRSQIILSSARGERAPRIAEFLGCDEQTVRNAIVAFNERGVAALEMGSRRPKTSRPMFSDEGLEKLKTLLHRSPRDFGKETSVWTLELAAAVSFAEGITSRQVSDDCVRQALKRLKVSWKRAKHWITSPDPAYERKKSLATE
ncbi:MAG TPA: helix-turn-helix domain-containing protein [Anaerolineales bacterium]|nr:helix-turn-helix domain-containing protein [Anaerolineales bacterium]